MTTFDETNERLLAELAAGEIDFVDLGSSDGGSIDYCRRRFEGPRGVGVDYYDVAVRTTRECGFDAIHSDVLKLDVPDGCVRFVSMMDFLEHLPDVPTIERVLAQAARIARDFLFIRHPSFEDEPYLEAVGLKQFWTDWPEIGAHTAHITIPEYTEIFRRIGTNQYCFSYRNPVLSSDHSDILPLDAPPSQHAYDPDAHSEKPRVEFPRPLYGQIDIFVALRTWDPDEWNRLTAPWD